TSAYGLPASRRLPAAAARRQARERTASATPAEGAADYEARWRPVATGVQASARDRVTEWFLPTSRARLVMRRWGFKALNVPGLDRILAGQVFPKSHRTVVELSA
ncbi:hypothetical protein AB0A73_27585, partial [Glycomyces sp. NPDC047369]